MTLKVEAVSVSLGRAQVVRDVSIALQPGQVTGLLGPNGAGKSTLMRAMAGQLPFSGSILFDGTPVNAMSDAGRARHIGWLPQTREVAWPLSVENLVALGRLPWHGWRRTRSPADREMVAGAMQMMEIGHLASRPATELSGGEQARVLLARAVAQDTAVLLADEPAAGLDPAHQISMMAAMRRLAARGRTVLVSLHDLSLAARWCDQLVVMLEGRIAGSGKPHQVMTQDMLHAVYGINAEIGHDQCGMWLAPLGLTQGDATP